MPTFKIIYTCKAENDLDSIFSFIAENNPMNALNYINRMQSAIENLAITPYIGVSCRAKGIKRDCRILIFTNYLIFYKVNEEKKQINILRILHGSRKYLDLLN
ncbi:Plasmid stabilization system [Candidatus Magnetomorum sp. HK-1]|nr:Plasmid stabilization system [Candidatus Magnetomorum sp. HK-1]